MKAARMLGIVGVAVGLVLAGLARPAGGTTWYVAASGADFSSIQAALDDPCTVDGDEIEVGPGTYYEAVDFNDKAVRLYSSGGAGVTTIDANGAAYHVVQCASGEDANTILEGFTITGGNANGSGTDAYGGGMYNDNSSPTVTKCIFIGNYADSGGGGMCNYYSSPTVTNCIFSENVAVGDGGGMFNEGSSPVVTNCTFYDNSAWNFGGGMYNYDYSSPTVTNCILWGQLMGGSIDDDMTSSATVTYSDVKVEAGVYPGTGNINSNPGFVNPFGGDLRLVSSASPCVDSGNNGAASLPATDLAGNPRVADGDLDSTATVDMGAYELQSKDIHNIGQDAYYETIQAAIDYAGNGHKIEVGAGTYNEAINFKGKGVRLYSRDGRDVTTIDASGWDSSVVTCGTNEGPNTVLAGFTITGGYALSGGGMCNLAASPSVVSCAFWRNTAGAKNTGGAGMYNYNSSPTVTNCIFSENTASLAASSTGGGMYNYNSSPTVTNCTFSGNNASQYGGGMYDTNSSPVVTNCTFSGNSANYYGGGVYNSSSSPTVTNCILWGNTAPTGPEIYDDGTSSSTVSYSDVEGGTGQGWFGTGCIDADPCFVDADSNDFRLLADSPCIDAGDNGVVTEPNDLDGNPRVADGDGDGSAVVDMGAYELKPPPYAYAPNPADGAEVVTKNPTLTWEPGVWADQHEVYFGTDYDDVNEATTASAEYKGNQEPNSYEPGTLVLGQTYYWKITEVNDGYVGPLTPPWEGDVWSFRVEGHAYDPSPADGDVNVPFMGVVLGWTAGAEAESHDLYIGTSFAEVNDATTSSSEFIQNQALGNTSYDLGQLVPDTGYYWRIDEVNATGGTFLKGDVWSFTVGEFLIADDFESYDNDFELWDVWDDYWVNGSDGVIWLENGADIIREPNSQAAKLEFTNMTHIGPGYIGSWFDVQDLTELDIGPDWTVGGVKALTLYMRGDPCNVNVLPGGPSAPELAAGRPWVELEDTSYWAGYVLYPDANDILEDIWHEWNIDLGIFDACDVTLSEIDRFTIGIGGYDKTGPSGEMSGYGQIWVDDIRLYVPRCRRDISRGGGDITGEDGEPDCVVDGRDLKIIAEQWLTSGPEADIVDDDIVNFEDYGMLGDNWLEELLWPPE